MHLTIVKNFIPTVAPFAGVDNYMTTNCSSFFNNTKKNYTQKQNKTKKRERNKRHYKPGKETEQIEPNPNFKPAICQNLDDIMIRSI